MSVWHPRTATLEIVAAALLVADGYWAYQRYFRLDAAITYVGLENLSMMVPASAHAAQLRDGKWNSDPYLALKSKFYAPPPGEKAKPMALVSLGPHPGLGQAVAVFRDLKARHVCHVLIREGAEATASGIDFGEGPETALKFQPLCFVVMAMGMRASRVSYRRII